MILAMKKGDFSMKEREMNELEREERRRRQQRKRLKQRSYSCQKREWRSLYQEIWGRTTCNTASIWNAGNYYI